MPTGGAWMGVWKSFKDYLVSGQVVLHNLAR